MAAIKTYVVLENDINSSRKSAYSYFVFPSLREVRNCAETNDRSIVFSTVEQLREAFTSTELLGVMESSFAEYPKTWTLSNNDTHTQFFAMTEFIATKYKPLNTEKPMTNEILHVDQFNNKTQKQEAAGQVGNVVTETKSTRVANSKYDSTAKIVVTGKNPYREGSNRWHNFEALAKSADVGEALTAMKALNPGGNSVDIRLAIEKGAIRLGA